MGTLYTSGPVNSGVRSYKSSPIANTSTTFISAIKEIMSMDSYKRALLSRGIFSKVLLALSGLITIMTLVYLL
jgi:hypothetical protein